MTLLLNEEFRDIDGYEGLYQVSNYGRVKSLERYVEKEYRNNRKHKERILSQSKTRDYYYVKLQKNKNKYNVGVHRLMAKAFIPNPNNLPEIDHIKPIKDGGINTIENLRWCTHEENMLKNETTFQKLKSKPVNCYDLDWNFIKTYRSINYASKQLNLVHSSIRQCCEGHSHHKRVGKYRFKFFKEEIWKKQ